MLKRNYVVAILMFLPLLLMSHYASACEGLKSTEVSISPSSKQELPISTHVEAKDSVGYIRYVAGNSAIAIETEGIKSAYGFKQLMYVTKRYTRYISPRGVTEWRLVDYKKNQS